MKKSFNKVLTNKEEAKYDNIDSRRIESNTNQIKLNKEDSKLTLVETIEELGFIPSVNKSEDKNAA